MWNKILIDYFSFTKKERIAVIALVIVITCVFLFPHFIPEKTIVVSKADTEQFQQQFATLKSGRRDSIEYPDLKENRYRSSYYHQGEFNDDKRAKGELFYFDPNTLSESGWKKLGVQDKTIKTIQKYLAKGGRFRNAEDIGKIYGLHKSDVERLMPYFRSNEAHPKIKNDIKEIKHFSSSSPRIFSSSSTYSKKIFDINTADTTDFISLPGIGNKLATRIINFRDKLGGFYSVEQIAETYGLPDSIFQYIRSRLSVSDKGITSININRADLNQLRQHPYIRWNIANAIVQFKNQHGDYKNKEDLLQIDIITPEVYKKLAPYIIVE